MAITVVRTNSTKGYVNLMFKSTPFEENNIEKIVIETSLVDEHLKMLPDIESSKSESDLEEEEFHTDLRKVSASEKQLISSLCTNPEWTPEDYAKTYEDFTKQEKNAEN